MKQLRLGDQARDEPAPPPPYLTIDEAARRVRCCDRTIRRAIETGALRAGRVRSGTSGRAAYGSGPRISTPGSSAVAEPRRPTIDPVRLTDCVPTLSTWAPEPYSAPHVALTYSIFSSTGDLIDAFNDRDAAIARRGEIVKQEPAAADDVLLVAQDDAGELVESFAGSALPLAAG